MSLLAGLNPLPETDLENQRVFVRADLGVTLKGSEIVDDSRLVLLAQTCKTLLDRGARVIVGGRFGDGKGELKSNLGRDAASIEPVAAKLAELSGLEVLLPDSCAGDAVKKVITSLRAKQICVLENLASEGDTGEGAEAFARELLGHIDVYVGDSMRALGHESATTTILPKLLERRYVGPVLMNELKQLVRLRSAVDRPRLLIWGGTTLSDRVPLLTRLAAHSEKVFFVGVAANTILAARGDAMGRSALEGDYLAGARTLLDQLGNKVRLPADVVTSTGPKDESSRVETPGNLDPARMALDIGPKTLEALRREIDAAGSVFLCGTVGFQRIAEFSRGTRGIFEALSESSAFTVVAGDDSVAAAQVAPPEVREKIFLSSGGSATLDLLNESKLPGLSALRGNENNDDPN